MRRLTTHPWSRRIIDDERGISLVFITITLLLLIGMAAFAIDAGALYQERRELQNGADAAAIAIAEDCALDAAPCTESYADGTAETYADLNATDGDAAVDDVTIDLAEREVTVTVSTKTPGGGTILTPFFAQVLGFGGKTVHATASAVWGYPSGLSTIPIIFSDCEWERETGSGADLLDAEGPWDPADESVLYFHSGTHNADDCAAVAGQDTDGDDRLPGGFGWLETDGDCEADIEMGGWVGDDPGASPSTGCGPSVFKDLVLNKIVFIPWFDDVNGLGGANGEYHVAGFGAMYVTGYNFGGQYKEPSRADAPCRGDRRCISGYFVEATVYEGELGGDDRGVVVVKFSG